MIKLVYFNEDNLDLKKAYWLLAENRRKKIDYYIFEKLYADDLKEEKFLTPEPLSNYKSGDFHRFYICRIEKVLKRVYLLISLIIEIIHFIKTLLKTT